MLNRILAVLLNPITSVPLVILFVVWHMNTFGDYSYPGISNARMPLALQGGTDGGGSMKFAVTMLCYFFYSVFAPLSVYSRPRKNAEKLKSYGAALRLTAARSGILIFLFLLGSLVSLPQDSRIPSNDFRNLFMFMVVFFSLELFFTAYILYTKQLPSYARWLLLLLPPILLLLLTGDGVTWKTGQLNWSDVEPQHIIRGHRHGLMMAWHSLCDSVFGDWNISFFG